MINSYHKLKSLKTLLIDDDPFIRDSMEMAFSQKGYPLRVVNTAEDGLRALEQEAFDIIISDYKLPGMNGLDFFRQVISKNPHKHKGFDLRRRKSRCRCDRLFYRHQRLSPQTLHPRCSLGHSGHACGEAQSRRSASDRIAETSPVAARVKLAGSEVPIEP